MSDRSVTDSGRARRRAIRDRRAALEAAGLSPEGAYASLADEFAAGAFGQMDRGSFYEAFHLPDKDAVFAGARRGGHKIGADSVVAATRLYTPDHIVAFLLQNTLGAIWSAMYPASRLRKRWPYLLDSAIGPPRAPRPLRELRILDPCCGCGAFLLAAFDMLEEMYEEERRLGSPASTRSVSRQETATTIVECNLWGADLDAGAVGILRGALSERAPGASVGHLAVSELPLGSLDEALWRDERFEVVCTNPPYLGFRQMDPALKAAVRAADPLAVSDLAVAFQSRCHSLLADGGRCGTVTPASWTNAREALPLRRRILSDGGPIITATLGQRVFDGAPLLFVAMVVTAKGESPSASSVLRTQGPGPDSLREGLRRVRVVPRAMTEGLPLAPFSPELPSELLAVTSGPRLGEVYRSFDGVWTGDNARDVRFWWEIEEPGWARVSGGQGAEPWVAPIRLRMPVELVAAMGSRDGGIEYPRVAGGRLSAREVEPGTASLAGVVTLVARGDLGDRRDEVLALFNSAVGTAWLRTLTSGLNFNPGYAAQIPLGAEPPGCELRTAVREVVRLRRVMVARDPTGDAFAGEQTPFSDDGLTGRVAAAHAAAEAALCVHLGVPLEAFATALRPAPRRVPDARSDAMLVAALRALGFRWPGGGAARPVAMSSGDLVGAIVAAAEATGARLDGTEVTWWVDRELLAYQRRRFRGASIIERTGALHRVLPPERRGRG